MPGKRGADGEDVTPVKRARLSTRSPLSASTATPSGPRSALRRTPSQRQADHALDDESTPRSVKRVLFSASSPQAPEEGAEKDESASKVRQRRASRALEESGHGGDDGDEEVGSVGPEHESLDPGDASDDAGSEILVASSTANTPSKRGRPKGRRRQKSPSPPPDLPSHELYFFHHRAGGNRTSSNKLPANLFLSHEEYLARIRTFHDPHEADMEALRNLHHRAFDQWVFELSEGFSICLYGYGSKRQLLLEFADHLHHHKNNATSTETASPDGSVHKIVVVNAYAPGLTIRDVVNTLATVIAPGAQCPVQPAAAVEMLLKSLDHKASSMSITLMMHSLDHPNLRKLGAQSLLPRLLSHPSIALVASCDNPNFALLWDPQQLSKYRWLYHDATTFAPYDSELEVVEDANRLLGRRTRRLGGKDGIAYVLKSLPENAQTLFRILIAEQLAAGVDVDVPQEDDMESTLGLDDADEAATEDAANTPSRRARGRKPKAKSSNKTSVRSGNTTVAPAGVEYRTLYHKAVEEFVCSSEVGFRTLLKEFHDHQMIESRKDAVGTERLIVPFRQEELEEVLGELV